MWGARDFQGQAPEKQHAKLSCLPIAGEFNRANERGFMCGLRGAPVLAERSLTTAESSLTPGFVFSCSEEPNPGRACVCYCT